MSKIAIIGTGYVGLVTGAVLSSFGHFVTCVDTDEDKIAKLNDGFMPIFEPGLDVIVKKGQLKKNLFFSTDTKRIIRENEVIFVAVGTPPNEDGSADLHYVFEVVEDIAENMESYKIIVNKSTVPIGTGGKVKDLITKILMNRGLNLEFDVVSNPEFLREGSAVDDFLRPDRIVIGAERQLAFTKIKEIYRVLYINEPIFVETNIETAEMIKYASNAFLAVKITFINEIANICEKVGADVKMVSKAMGQDGRISPKFLHAGPGYGGSCFPKDTKALTKIAQNYEERITIVEATIKANERQKVRMVEKILSNLNSVENKIIAILGVTFKPNTDDLRDAPSLIILPELAKAGAKLRIYDPEGRVYGVDLFAQIKDSIIWCNSVYEAIENTHATVILTQWNEFRGIDFEKYQMLNAEKVLFDFRNIYNKNVLVEQGFKYYGVGV